MSAQKPTYPEFAKEAPITAQNDFKIRVAIDFGTDGVALAYAFGETDKVTAHAEWSSQKYPPKYKPKTIILLDEDDEALGFGKDAKHTYITTDKMKDKWNLFERFKMALYDDDGAPDLPAEDDDEKKGNNDGKISINNTLTARNGQTVQASVVFIAAFKYLQKQAKDYLKRNRATRKLFASLKNCDYQWIITVPAIWNDEAKYRMREWVIDAGLVDPKIEDQCKIVYEPDCASLAIQYQINQNKSGIRSVIDVPDDDDAKERDIGIDANFSKGEKYILVDAGGGTVDIACHEILGENGEYGVKEILHPSGGPWGSCYIDDQFVKLMKDIFGGQWIEEFKKENANIYTELVDNFQKAKETFYQKPEEEAHNVRMPYDFIGFIQDKLETQHDLDDTGIDIEQVVALCKAFGKSDMVSLNEEYLKIRREGWKILFDHVMNPVISHVKKLLTEPKLMRNCKYLCLVGGLSTSPYFQTKMKQELGPNSKYQLKLIVPKRPILSVVEGAAYFAITPNYIKARVLRYTYGEILCFPISKAQKLNVSSEYIENNKFYNEYKKDWSVKGCFKVIARKNEEIYTGEIKKSSGNRSNPQQKYMATTIMWSKMEDPKVKADGMELGKVRNEFPNQDEDDMSATVEFHFYDTVIKAVVYRDKDPKDKQTHYITNYI